MPNLLPNWSLTLPWDLGLFNTRAAGRLIWATLLLVIGIAFVVALIKPPVMKRPFPLAAGIALFPVLIIGGLVLGALITSLQRTIILAAMAAVVAHAFMLVISREPRDPERKATWAESIAGAVGAFALFALGYAIVPHEYLTFANAQLQWGDNSKFVWKSTDKILGILPVHYPFNFDFPALRDIVVTLMYVVILGLNLKLFVMWQKRLEVKPEPAGTETTPARRSRFGRPLRRAEPVTAGAPAEGA